MRPAVRSVSRIDATDGVMPWMNVSLIDCSLCFTLPVPRAIAPTYWQWWQASSTAW